MHNALSLTDNFKTIFLGIIVLSIFACSDVQKRPEPENLLSEQQMISIYTDMMLLDAIYRTNPKKLNTYDLEASEHIYNKYNIDSTTLAENMNYYNLDFEVNSRIYDSVSSKIENRKQKIDSIVKLRDSLQKIEAEKAKDSLQPELKKNTKTLQLSEKQ